MLTIQTVETEGYNESTHEIFVLPAYTLHLEHSLFAISKWEAKWKKAFLGKDAKTGEESLDYIRCMTLDDGVPPEVYYTLTQNDMDKISAYIEDSMTATWFHDDKRPHKSSRETPTSELIYYWMVALQIPFECQYWHLNRLLTLVHICNIKNEPPKKMSNHDALARSHSINQARRAASHKGV